MSSVIGELPLTIEPATCTDFALSAATFVAAKIAAGDLSAIPLPDEEELPPQAASATASSSAASASSSGGRRRAVIAAALYRQAPAGPLQASTRLGAVLGKLALRSRPRRRRPFAHRDAPERDV